MCERDTGSPCGKPACGSASRGRRAIPSWSWATPWRWCPTRRRFPCPLTLDLTREIARHNRWEIPREVHQVWLGPKRYPSWYRRAWEAWCARYGYAYACWGHERLKTLGIETSQAYTHFISRENYTGASGVARLIVLLAKGGIYVDMDIAPIDLGVPLHDLVALMGLCCLPAGHLKDHGHGAFDFRNGILCSTREHPILSRYAAAIDGSVLGQPAAPAWWSAGGCLLTASIAGSVALLHPSLVHWAPTEDDEAARRAHAQASLERKAAFFLSSFKHLYAASSLPTSAAPTQELEAAGSDQPVG